jgi:hypothetical protein
VGIGAGIALAPQRGGISCPDTPLIRRGREIAGDRGRAAPTVGSAATVRPPSRYLDTQETEMGHHDQDPGHGEPGHVHDETWNREMLATDDGTTVRDDTVVVDRSGGTAPENQEGGHEAMGAGAGALAGAGIGMAVGGPPGAVVGGAIGAVGGAVAGEATEGNDEAGSGGGALAGGVAGAAIGGAVAGPPGAVVGGAVGAAGGAGAGDQAEEEVEESDTVVVTDR